MTDLYDYSNGPSLSLDPTTPRQVTYQNGWPVPAGWKLVPDEPTREMKIAGDTLGTTALAEYDAALCQINAALSGPTTNEGA